MTKPRKPTTRKTGTSRKPAARHREPAMATQQSPVQEPDRVARQFGLRTILSRPVYLTQSGWLEHIPFAFWLMEAQKPATFIELGTDSGASYFAFCQAAERLEMDIDCFAIGAWPGDPEGEARFAALRQHNEAHYSAFSRLKRGEAEEEAAYFTDKSVDLLHIHGTRSFHRTRAALESWLPRLSERAVVILHDSDMRANGYGVARLVADLKGSHPVFEFKHGRGLAVIGVGPEQNESLAWLFEAGNTPASRSAIQNIFGRLGRACGDSYLVQEYQGLYHQSCGQIAALKEQIDTLLNQVAPPSEATGGLLTQHAPVAALPQPAAPVASAPAPDPDVATLQADLRTAQSGLQDRFEEIAALVRMVQELEQEKGARQSSMDQARQTFDEEAATLQQTLADREAAIEDLRAQLASETELRMAWERMFHEIETSRFWKLTAPARGLLGTLRRR